MKHLKSSSGINAEYGRCMSTKSELLGAVWSAPFVVQPKLFTDTLSLVIKAIKLEMKLYQKILYNHNNSHKKTKYWQKLRQVKGWVLTVNTALSHFLPTAETVGGTTKVFNYDNVLNKLYALYQMCEKSMDLIRATYLYLVTLLEQTFFMKLSLSLVGCLSRFYALLKCVTEVTMDNYNNLQKEKKNSEEQKILFTSNSRLVLNGVPKEETQLPSMLSTKGQEEKTSRGN
eukprot:TRINITY_DN2692_c0_g1_i15.p1 TRINITY_DN2692_c0_g1~~TRINITY_DN2692_c0_g1_i15.p1  ORF type:complete len:240 (-),score=44.96 TRINITY_DN2692_c0_g1_i15:264-953(-)